MRTAPYRLRRWLRVAAVTATLLCVWPALSGCSVAGAVVGGTVGFVLGGPEGAAVGGEAGLYVGAAIDAAIIESHVVERERSDEYHEPRVVVEAPGDATEYDY